VANGISTGGVACGVEQVINFWIGVQMQKELANRGERKAPKYHIFNTYFYAQLTKGAQADYQAVTR
jgi:Ulp1 family protease